MCHENGYSKAILLYHLLFPIKAIFIFLLMKQSCAKHNLILLGKQSLQFDQLVTVFAFLDHIIMTFPIKRTKLLVIEIHKRLIICVLVMRKLRQKWFLYFLILEKARLISKTTPKRTYHLSLS